MTNWPGWSRADRYTVWGMRNVSSVGRLRVSGEARGAVDAGGATCCDGRRDDNNAADDVEARQTRDTPRVQPKLASISS